MALCPPKILNYSATYIEIQYLIVIGFLKFITSLSCSLFRQQMHNSVMYAYNPTCCCSNLQGGNTNTAPETYSYKIGHNKHTSVVVQIVQDFTGFGLKCVHKCNIMLVKH